MICLFEPYIIVIPCIKDLPKEKCRSWKLMRPVWNMVELFFGFLLRKLLFFSGGGQGPCFLSFYGPLGSSQTIP